MDTAQSYQGQAREGLVHGDACESCGGGGGGVVCGLGAEGLCGAEEGVRGWWRCEGGEEWVGRGLGL